MLLNNSIGGTIFFKGYSLSWASFHHYLRKGGGGLGALANLKEGQYITLLAKCSIQMEWGGWL